VGGGAATTPLRRGYAPLHPRKRRALYPVLVLRTRLRSREEVGREGREKLRTGRRMCGGVYEVALNNLSLIYLIDGPLPVSSIFDGVSFVSG
jgi:hypothetical protein